MEFKKKLKEKVFGHLIGCGCLLVPGLFIAWLIKMTETGMDVVMVFCALLFVLFGTYFTYGSFRMQLWKMLLFGLMFYGMAFGLIYFYFFRSP